MKDVSNGVKTSINRRSFVKNGLSAGAVGVGLLASSPTVFAKKNPKNIAAVSRGAMPLS
jgi:hypothetical protein